MFSKLIATLAITLAGTVGYCGDVSPTIKAGGNFPATQTDVAYTRQAWASFNFYNGTTTSVQGFPGLLDDNYNTLVLSKENPGYTDCGGVWFTRNNWGGWYFIPAQYQENIIIHPIYIPTSSAGAMLHDGLDIIATGRTYESANGLNSGYAIAYTRPLWGGIYVAYVSTATGLFDVEYIPFPGISPVADRHNNHLEITDINPRQITLSYWRDGWATKSTYFHQMTLHK